MGKIYVCITVDWEGENLNGISDLLKIRKKIGEHIPFTHFVCPNYFLSKKKKENIGKIEPALYSNDEVGLHVHCYKSLIDYVDVTFKTDMNYYNNGGLFKKYKKVSGRGVPLTIYCKDEIKRIISASKNILEDALNLPSISGFRAGGWLINDDVVDIIEELGFAYDSSSVPPSVFSQGFESINNQGNYRDKYGMRNGTFTSYLIQLWGGNANYNGFFKNIKLNQILQNRPIQIDSQPFRLNKTIEIPNNCALSDFCSYNTVLSLINILKEKIIKAPQTSYFVVYGCHQEGLAKYKIDLLKLFQALKEYDASTFKFIRMHDVERFYSNGFHSVNNIEDLSKN